jgi:hypothetical protein
MARTLHLSILLIALFIFPRTFAQSYILVQGTAPYEEITNGTPVAIQGGWGQITALDGEAFSYFDQQFVFGGAWQIWVHQSGFLNIDHAPESTIFISMLFKNFNDLQPIDATSSITYSTSGSSGNKKLVVQWKNYRSAGGPANNYANFQVILDQVSGEIAVHYGPTSHPDHMYTSGTGPNAGIYYADYDASPIYERLWLTGSPLDPTIETATTWTFPGLQQSPPEDMLYRFMPNSGSYIAENKDEISTWYANDRLYMNNVHMDLEAIEIIDASGRTVLRSALQYGNTSIDVGSLDPGMYVPLMHTSSGIQRGGKFLKY